MAIKGPLKQYASGDGSLSFAFQNKYDTNAHPDKVSVEDAHEYMEKHKDFFDGYKLAAISGQVKAYTPVERVDTNTVKIGQGVPTYYKYSEDGHILKLWELRADELLEVKNGNTLAQVGFFLNNEKELSHE